MTAQRILVVEDEPDARQLLTLLFQLEGYDVSAAADGRQALDYLEQEPPPSLILLDLMMPGVSGWEVRQAQLRNPRLADIPVIIQSGVVETAHWEADLGNARLLAKPVEPAVLLETVREIVQKS